MRLLRRRKRRHEDEPLVVTRKVTLGDLADPNRPTTTYVERPDQYTAVDHAAATAPVDRVAVTEMVRGWVHEALAAGALDEFTDDFLDARIDTLRAGWDAAVEAERNSRAGALDQLRAMENHDLTEMQGAVRRLRDRIPRLEAEVAAWKAVLQGSPIYDPDHYRTPVASPPVAPVAVDLTAAIAASRPLARTEPAATTLVDGFGPMTDLLTELEKEEALR